MAMSNWVRSGALLVLGAILGGLFVASWEHSTAKAQQNNPPVTQATLVADVTHLRDITPPNSHPMVDVGMFAANLWFAGDKKNWPLANYYLGELRNRIRWEVRVNPSPKGADGNPVDMANILDGIDKQFSAEYKMLLEDCYSCHKTAGRPYLRPMVPVSGAQPIVNLDPAATWPQ